MTHPSLALLMDRFTRRVHLGLQAKAAAFDRYGVGPGGGMVLMLLDEAGPMPMQDLAREMVRDKSQMTRVIGPMQRKGLVTRVPGPEDARQSVVSLTSEGHIFVEELRAVVSETIDDVLSPLPAKDRTRLVALLTAALG